MLDISEFDCWYQMDIDGSFIVYQKNMVNGGCVTLSVDRCGSLYCLLGSKVEYCRSDIENTSEILEEIMARDEGGDFILEILCDLNFEVNRCMT